MIPSEVYALGASGNPIREIADYAMRRAEEVGAENVYDFSIGSPSIASPAAVQETAQRLMQEMSPTQLHAYSPDQGLPEVRRAVADYLNGAFSMTYAPEDIYMTSGASAGLAIGCRALLSPGDEAVTLTPYFSEYRTYTEAAGGVMREVPSEPETFQLDYDAFAAAVNEKTWLVILNSPNNPSGAILSEQTLRVMAKILKVAEEEQGRSIYLVSDEPYRELVYGDVTVPFVPNIYHNTLVCYSYSKSFSLPGERIGYIMVPPCVKDSGDVFAAVCGAGRALGYVCAPSLMQHMLAKCVDVRPDITSYAKNRDTLYDALSSMGFACVKPDGAFYLFIKAPGGDSASEFCEKAKGFEILLVPSDSFGVEGYARLAYCVSEKTVEDSLPAFKKLAEAYGL